MNEANSLLACREFEAAVSLLQRQIRAGFESAVIYRDLGIAYQQLGNDAEAAKAYRKSISLDPTDAQSLANLGDLMLQHCNPAGAIDCFRRAFESTPGSAFGHLQLAKAFSEEGKLKRAEECLVLALKLEPGLADAHAVYGALLRQRGDFDLARSHLEKALGVKSGCAPAHFELAYLSRFSETDRPRAQQMEEALSKTRALEDQRLLNYALGKAHEDLGECEEAMRYYDCANEVAGELTARKFDQAAYGARGDEVIEASKAQLLALKTQDSSPSTQHSTLNAQLPMPLLVVGMIRSGTTLVEQILSRHPAIAAGGELQFWIEHGPALLSARPGDQRLANAAQEYLDLLRSVVARNSSGAASPSTEAARRKTQDTRHSGNTRCEDPNALRVTDKMPLNFMYLGVILAACPEARIIHCRRNPNDTCLSIYTTPYPIPPDFGHDRENIAFAYRQYLRLMDDWRAVLPASNFLEIDYEELVRDPEPLTKRMIDFAGLEWDNECLSEQESNRAIRTPSSWQARQPVYQSSIERWRKFEPWLGPLRILP